MKLEQFG